MSDAARPHLVDLDLQRPVWDRFFTVAPLVLIGTTDPDGSPDLAPKHMVTPMGWQNYFGFVCAPTHSTCSEHRAYRRIHRELPEAVAGPLLEPRSFATPGMVTNPYSTTYETHCGPPGRCAPLIEEAYLYFECRHLKTIAGLWTQLPDHG